MKNNLPKFTVIIPQKDRAEYLYHTLRTCMIQDYPNFEVIVSDDCSSDNSVEVVENLSKIDPRIKLYAHKKHIGMHDNFEFALNQISEGYVIALGGDDGLTPNCIWRMYEIIMETGRELLTWTPATFCYSDPNSQVRNNIFYLKRKRNRGVEIRKSAAFLNKIARTFQYQIDECPMFYMKGVASITLINRVKSRSKNGFFYQCPTPDGYSGIVLAGEVEDYAFTWEPLSIAGNTVKSQGANYRRTDEKSIQESKQFFDDNSTILMHAELASQPYSPLSTLMTADYLLTARDLPGWPGRFNDFTMEDLLRASFKHIENSYFASEVLVRELRILKEIAKQHDLLPLFENLLCNTQKKAFPNKTVYGFVITNSIRFDGSKLGINNIFDASIATPIIYNSYNQISIKSILKLFKNQIMVVVNSRRTKKESLPSI